MTPDRPSLPPAALPARRTTPDHVADILREAILTGALEDEQELNQVALAEHFSVSRVPVREALRQLKAEGLVRQEAHQRAVVSSLGDERIMELFDLRVRLETYLLTRAAGRVTDRDLGRLRSAVHDMESMSEHGEWLQRNREFHRQLYELAGATFAQELAEQIAARSTRYLYLRSGGEGVERQAEADREHHAVLDALAERDADRAVAVLTDHIEATRARVRSLLDQRRRAEKETARG